MSDKSGQDLYTEYRARQIERENMLGTMGRYGRQIAKKRQEYKVALAKRVLVEKANKTPTSLVRVISEGDENVALKEMEWKSAEVEYEIAKETVNSLKIDSKYLSDEIDREYRG